MNLLGNGLSDADHDEDALSVREAELAMCRRFGDSEANILCVQANLATTYALLGRKEQALRLRRDVYSGRLKLSAEYNEHTLMAANNYASSLGELGRFEEAKGLMRKVMPVAQRALGESAELTLQMRLIYAWTLFMYPAATLADLRAAVTTLEDAGRIARRVFGGAHPTTKILEYELRKSQATLRARETGDENSLRDAMEALTPAGGGRRPEEMQGR